MATTVIWSVNSLDRETADGFVMTAHYRVDANDGTYQAGAYGSLSFERPDTLIPYADLTQETVIGWVKEKLTAEKVAEVEAALQSQLDEQREPTKASGVPW
jgi:hypothetical protein